MLAKSRNRWRSKQDDSRLMAAYDAMKGGDASADDWEILLDYAQSYSYKKAIEAGLSPVDAEIIATKVGDRFIKAIKGGLEF